MLKVLANGQPHQYKELVEKTGMSEATVTKHLKHLEEKGHIAKEIDFKSNRYPYPVTYKLSQTAQTVLSTVSDLDQVERIHTSWILMKKLSDASAIAIKELEDRKEAKSLLNQYLNFNLDTLVTDLLLMIYGSYFFSKGYSEKRKWPIEKQFKILSETKNLENEYIKKFVQPWIESIARTVLLNRDVSSEVIEELIPKMGSHIDLSFLEKLKELSVLE